jgi:hypothetical protein
MSRMVGGTFGVAVMGALVSALGRSKIDQLLPQLPASARASIANSIGGGGSGQGHQVSAQIVSAVHEAFVSALSTGLTIGAATTLVGAVLAFTLIEPMPKQARSVSEPEAGTPVEVSAA